MTQKAPGKHYRGGLSLIELMDMFPSEASAAKWFETVRWPDTRFCGKCGSERTRRVKSGKPMPFWCTACRSYFSVRTGTPLACSNIPLRKWAISIYLCLTSLKSVSSMKLHRDLRISQKAAWFMLHRIREAWGSEGGNTFGGPVEVDETYFGGKRKNMSKSKRNTLSGRGAIGKTAVVGVKDRETNEVKAKVVRSTKAETLQGFVRETVDPGAQVFTDDATAYLGLTDYEHDSVRHSVAEYVRGMVHTNGVESFWSMLKRAHKGTFHKISPKHLDRYVQEFAGKHNIRDLGTIDQMGDTVISLVGHRLLYRDLVADNGLDSMARA